MYVKRAVIIIVMIVLESCAEVEEPSFYGEEKLLPDEPHESVGFNDQGLLEDSSVSANLDDPSDPIDPMDPSDLGVTLDPIDSLDPSDLGGSTDPSDPMNQSDLGVTTDPSDPYIPCNVNGTSGECLHVSECNGVTIPGFCPGTSEIQCCLDDLQSSQIECTVNQQVGECLDVSLCQGNAIPGHCPGAASIQCCIEEIEPPNTHNQCVESPTWDQMPRPNEGLSEERGDQGCPDGMALINTFCIDRYEASLVEILSNGTERSWSPYFNPQQRLVYAVSLRYAIPQGYISGQQAQQACQAAGKRLCTDQEWLRACGGSDLTLFPYGEIRIWGQCNDSRTQHPAISYFGTNNDQIWSMLSNPCINQQPESLTSNDQYQECVSDEGVYHMVGGLHEWTSDPNGTFRGGFYADTMRNGQGCQYRTTAHNFAHSDYSTGFRCCSNTQ